MSGIGQTRERKSSREDTREDRRYEKLGYRRDGKYVIVFQRGGGSIYSQLDFEKRDTLRREEV